MFLYDGEIYKWHIPFLYYKKRLFTRRYRILQQAEAFPVGTWKGIVSAAPTQANYLIRIMYLDNHSAKI